MPKSAQRALQDLRARETMDSTRLGNWAYWQWATWRRLPDLPTRLRWLGQLVFPDIAHLQLRYGEDGAGRGRLLWRRWCDGLRRLRGYLGS